jgi:hypothetical protein
MGHARRRRIVAVVAGAVGTACALAALGVGCSDNGTDNLPASAPDCNLALCLQKQGQPTPVPAVQGSGQVTDAGLSLVDAEVVPADGSGIPSAGPGPGISGTTTSEGVGNTTELGPVCPVTAPTNGAPCSPVVNTIACVYSIETCFCTTDWICF